MKNDYQNKRVVTMLAHGEVHHNETILDTCVMKLPKVIKYPGENKTDTGNVREVAYKVIEHLSISGKLADVNRDMVRIYVGGIVLPRWSLNQSVLSCV